jgi:flagellar hook-associated protein 3 FlgL
MRITTQMVVDSTLRNIEANQQRTSDLQNQITSGSRVFKPSDDPIGVARALDLQDGISQAEQYLRNIDQGTSWLNTTDSVLQSVSDAMARARELAVQSANDSLSTSDRTAIKAEINQIQQHVLDLTHSRYGANYIFSGTASTQPGYLQAADSTTTPAAYQGNSDQALREISPGTTISINTDAQATFDPIFSALTTLQSGLSSNTTATIQTSIAQFDTALDALNMSRAQVGAKTNRLDFLKSRQESVNVNMTGLLSTVKDVDMAVAITNFSMAQNVYQASLKAAAQAIQPSLLDYLK